MSAEEELKAAAAKVADLKSQRRELNKQIRKAAEEYEILELHHKRVNSKEERLARWREGDHALVVWRPDSSVQEEAHVSAVGDGGYCVQLFGQPTFIVIPVRSGQYRHPVLGQLHLDTMATMKNWRDLCARRKSDAAQP